jgi:hypothetical protein
VRIARLVVQAGFFLIGLGIGALVWSYVLDSGPNASAHAWWVGTLQALGVGFVVGGIVDVLAVSGIQGATQAAEERRKEANKRARDILQSKQGEREKQEGLALLRESIWLLDEDVRQALADFVLGQPGPAE